MPTYDMRCPGCGRESEELVRIADRHSTPCPDCGELMKLLPSAPEWWGIGYGFTPKFHHPGKLRAECKTGEDSVFEDSNGKLRPKTGAGHDAPGR